MWRLRAETAAARAGDFQAVRALASGATLAEPPPGPEAAAAVQHLQARLVRSLARQAQQVSQRIVLLRSLSPGGAIPHHIDMRR